MSSTTQHYKTSSLCLEGECATKDLSSYMALISGHVAITRNLVRRNMRCDNYCPRCGAPEETVTHAIF